MRPPREAPLCARPLSLCACGSAVVCACAHGACVYAADTCAPLAEYPLPPAVRCMCALPGALYALSGEADSLSLFCPLTGRLRLCARVGCDPRDAQLSPDGRLLAVAGGAAGQVYLLSSRDLRTLRSIPLPGVVGAACFSGAALLAFCAEGDSEIHSCLYHISVRGVVREVLRRPGLPGALLALPDGSVLAGVLGELLHLRADGRVLGRARCGLPARLRLMQGCALCADPLDGRVLRLSPREMRCDTIWQGESPADALMCNL